MYRLTTTLSRTPRMLSLRPRIQLRYSSGSPIAGNTPPDQFTKTGEKEDDPMKVNLRSSEYSQSGGDEMVAAQSSASFSADADPASQKATAGKGNVVNPLELSPATPELSKYFEDMEATRSAEREASQHTGKGISRKAKTVEKTKIDFK